MEEDDDMDSLFEGMDVFVPSTTADVHHHHHHPHPPSNIDDHHHHYDAHHDDTTSTNTIVMAPPPPTHDDASLLHHNDTPSPPTSDAVVASPSPLQPNQFDLNLPSSSHINSLISHKLSLVHHQLLSVSAARKHSISTRRKAALHLDSATSNLRDLESQLQYACEAEDFETADNISSAIASLDQERHSLLLALKDAEAQCDASDSQLQLVLDSLISAELECASLLHSFAQDAQKDADILLQEARELSSKELDIWFSSTEALEGRKIELGIESYFINEARLSLGDSIDQLIKNDMKEKEILCQKQETLTDELQKLLALVREKEIEISENNAKIKAVDDRIESVVSGFQEIQSGIDAKYDSLQSVISQMQLQSQALSDKRKEIDALLSEEEECGAKLKELARESENEAKAYEEVVELRQSIKSSILAAMEHKARLAKTEEKLTEDVQLLQQEAAALRNSLQELSTTKSSIQQNLSSSKQRIIFIDKRVPELEAEKKVAAAGRNFKEAARVAAEAKSLSVEKEGLHDELEKATKEVEKIEEDIKDTITKIEEIEGVMASKEKEVAKAWIQRLQLTARAAEAERIAALELGDEEEAKLLELEAEAAKTEAKRLGPTYDDINEEQMEELPKQLISMELVCKLSGKQLKEVASSSSNKKMT